MSCYPSGSTLLSPTTPGTKTTTPAKKRPRLGGFSQSHTATSARQAPYYDRGPITIDAYVYSKPVQVNINFLALNVTLFFGPLLLSILAANLCRQMTPVRGTPQILNTTPNHPHLPATPGTTGPNMTAAASTILYSIPLGPCAD